MRAKLGLASDDDADPELINGLHNAMLGQNVDFTQLFRRLADAARGDATPARALFDEPEVLDAWLDKWLARLGGENRGADLCADAMDKVNAIYIPRNHKVEEALEAATRDGDFAPFERLLGVLSAPFEKHDGHEKYETPAPEGSGPHVTFCGT